MSQCSFLMGILLSCTCKTVKHHAPVKKCFVFVKPLEKSMWVSIIRVNTFLLGAKHTTTIGKRFFWWLLWSSLQWNPCDFVKCAWYLQVPPSSSSSAAFNAAKTNRMSTSKAQRCVLNLFMSCSIFFKRRCWFPAGWVELRQVFFNTVTTVPLLKEFYVHI